MLTEIWFKTKDKAVRLPVIPSEFERVIDAGYDTNAIIGLGDVAVLTSNGLAQLSLSSFFPNQEYSFNEYSNVPKPYDLVKYFKEWKNKGTVVRVILTGTDINQEMYITNFSYGERDGTGDVYYNMDLLEYRPITIPVITESNSNNTQNTSRPADTNNKSNSSNKQKTHKVVKGDCLWDIAQKYYGKGSLYPKIKEANKSKYPSLAKNNVIYVNWELIIP
ncbi:LysM peptidoglycan-binding domain-containing protein [uncultured Clostridium sp.]|jgi:LysM repeat protein|uniref:LysM peptidoglycan-binding domain-containing protein n=1 Tax=uncultured Clostridium sp. TaxID=59620 RepID=UPI0025D95846|nr:LysM peptidoglycan-binding domain-containing protein [uncultured Clostridium sp.]